MSYLLVAVILLMTYILQDLNRNLPLLDFVFAAAILATVYVAGSERRWLIAAVLLAVPTLILSAFTDFTDWPPDATGYLYLVFVSAYISFAAVAVIREIMLAERVTVHTISGAMVVYLLIGLLWALLYVIVEAVHPESYSLTQDGVMQAANPPNLLPSLTYFSLITLSSAGFGDITPLSDIARTLASMEAVFGQVFLAVLVAWLVGKYLSHSESNRHE